MEPIVNIERPSYSQSLSIRAFIVWLCVAIIWSLVAGYLLNETSSVVHVWYVKVAELFIILPPIMCYSPIRKWAAQQWNFAKFLRFRSIWLIVIGFLSNFLVNYLTDLSVISSQIRSFFSGPVSILSLNEHYNANPIQAWLFIIGGCVIAPICEELLFRGVILNYLKKRYNLWIGLLVSSILFGLGHLEPDRLLSLVLSGIILGLVAHYSKSILSSMVVHGLWNFFVIVFLMHILSVFQLF